MLETIYDTLRSMHWAEIGAVVCGLVYVVLAARENSWCWPWGIVGSILSVYLFFEGKLYAESVLYLYYIIAGFYGWYAWKFERRVSERHQIVEWPWRYHLLLLAGGVGLAFCLYLFLSRFTDAQMPLVDAHTTIFSFIATFMVTRKVLSNWIYWIVIDAVSVYLYAERGFFLYAGLMILYVGIAIFGFLKWRQLKQGSL